MRDNYEDRVKHYENNGMRKNIAVLCTKVDMMYDDMKIIKKKIGTVASTKTRSKINTSLIIIIIVAIIGLAFK